MTFTLTWQTILLPLLVIAGIAALVYLCLVLAKLLDTLKKILNIEVGEVTYDGRFMIEEVPCFGACDVAPAIRINGKVYGHLDTPEKVRSVLSSLM